MSKLLSLIVALSLVVIAVPAFAQGGKASCNDICLKRCATSGSKSYCMSPCVPQCNQKRGS